MDSEAVENSGLVLVILHPGVIAVIIDRDVIVDSFIGGGSAAAAVQYAANAGATVLEAAARLFVGGIEFRNGAGLIRSYNFV